MTPAELRSARKRLGLTQKGLAKALRMGTHGWQSISKWERDGGTVPGPVQVAVELLLHMLRLAERFAAMSKMAAVADPGSAYFTGYWAAMQVAYADAAAALRASVKEQNNGK